MNNPINIKVDLLKLVGAKVMTLCNKANEQENFIVIPCDRNHIEYSQNEEGIPFAKLSLIGIEKRDKSTDSHYIRLRSFVKSGAQNNLSYPVVGHMQQIKDGKE